VQGEISAAQHAFAERERERTVSSERDKLAAAFVAVEARLKAANAELASMAAAVHETSGEVCSGCMYVFFADVYDVCECVCVCVLFLTHASPD
jgi:hypothetical protein